MLQVELPFPPSVNHYWRMWRGRMVISAEGRVYRRRVVAILRSAGVQPLTGPLAVSIEVYPPDHRRRDLDNLLKSLGDSLEHGGAFHDDSQIVWLLIEKAAVVRGGKAVVYITARTVHDNQAELLGAAGVPQILPPRMQANTATEPEAPPR